MLLKLASRRPPRVAGALSHDGRNGHTARARLDPRTIHLYTDGMCALGFDA